LSPNATSFLILATEYSSSINYNEKKAQDFAPFFKCCLFSMHHQIDASA